MIINPYSFGGLDPDAEAFLTASGITDSTISSAINTLVTTMKSDGIWTKMKAIYPMVGGTASTHKFNLKDPRDLDAAFRVQFFGGWTHSANGALPNGTNAYANTFFNPTINALQNNHSFSFYSRTNSNGMEVEIGGANSNRSFLEIRTTGITYFSVNGGSTNFDSITDANSLGFYQTNRISITNHDLWKNGVKILAGTLSSSVLANINYYLGALNIIGNATFYSTKQCAFSTIGEGLSDTESANLYTAVQAFQTTLSRQV